LKNNSIFPQIKIVNSTISQDTLPFFISEVGSNHQGSVEHCKKLMLASKEAGASAVKLQKRFNKTFYSKKLYDEKYTNPNSFAESYGEHREFLDFNKEQWKELLEFANENDIVLFSTAFDIESADFLEDLNVRLVGVEAGGRSLKEGEHAARFEGGKLGVLQGCKTWILQNPDGQINPTHSVSAGLDYAAIGPEHAYYRDLKRIDFAHAGDQSALEAFRKLSCIEGILPALETSHGLAHAFKRASEMSPEKIICVNLSGRGDKDAMEAARLMGVTDLPKMQFS